MWVDDSAWTLLTASFLILVVACFQLIGWWGAWWTPTMVGCFFAAILVQMYNYYANNLSGSVQISTELFSLLAVLVGTVLLSKLSGALSSVAVGGLQLGLVILILAWGYGQVSSWTADHWGWGMSMWAYVLIVLFVALLVSLALRRLAGWRWFSRIFNLLLVTFIATQAARVIAERDPYSGFGTTEIEVLDFDTTWFVEWVLMTLAYVFLYYQSYKHVPWHHERHIDAKDAVYKEFLKAENAIKQATKKEKRDNKAKMKALKERAKALELEPQHDTADEYLLSPSSSPLTTTAVREEGVEGGVGGGSTLLYPEIA